MAVEEDMHVEEDKPLHECTTGARKISKAWPHLHNLRQLRGVGG